MLLSNLPCVALLALPLACATEVLLSSASVAVARTEPPEAHITPFNHFQTRTVDDDDDSLPGTLIAIADTTNTLELLTADNGNLVLGQISNTSSSENWLATNNTVFADSNKRFLHYFPDLISAYGVSRLRVAAWGSIPIGANIISFSQIAAGNTSIILAIDTEQKYYWPVACTYDGGANKLFLVNQTSDLDFVMDPSLRPIITGGSISECDHLALISSGLNSTSSD